MAGATDPAVVAGPAALGRGVVVNVGQSPPAPWADAPLINVDDAAVEDPSTVVPELHEHWARRRPVVVALAVDPARFRAPESWPVEPWSVDAGFEPWLDRLHFLVWSNNVDARGDVPVWWWAAKAARVGGAEATPDGPADIRLADGAPAFVDGGPRRAFAADDVGGAAVVASEQVDAGRLRTSAAPSDPTGPVSNSLAPDQRAAVVHAAGPARVLAPAGSGKTRVLTERLRHLIVDRGYDTSQVLAVAYNVKARDEMVERTTAFAPRVQTLNGLSFELLRMHRGAAPQVIEEREVRRVVEQLAPKHRPRANTDPLAPYLEALGETRLGLRHPEAVEDGRDDVPGFADLFAPYRAELARRGVVDFDEQVYGAVEALLHDGGFRRNCQQRYRHLLVDEFQDLTPAHVLMLRLLAAPGFDLFGVGDDDQVIYGHAGADPVFLTDYDRFVPAAASHPLEVNYRCPSAVVDGARHLLSYNHRRVDKEIRPGPEADPSEEGLTVTLHAGDAGAGALVDAVRPWIDEGVPPKRIAVLARVRSLLLAPHVALSEAGIPIRSILTPDVLTRTGVRAALAYLRIATSPDSLDPEDLAEVYRRPSRGLPAWITKWFARARSIDDVRRIAERLDDDRAAMKVDDLAADLDLLVATGGTTRRLLTTVRDQIGLGGAMEQLDRSKGGEGSSQLDDLEALLQVADLHDDPAGFEPWLRTAFHREVDAHGVTLSTVHRVKGREWDRVAVFGATAGLLPHRLAANTEEERRVLHVAVTRARHRATVLGDESAPSPFLAELDGSAPHAPEEAEGGAGSQPSLPGATAAPAGGAGEEPLTGEAARVEEALRAWRTERSRTDAVPAYVVASNATLRAIAEARPDSARALVRVPGIGPAKLDRYGDQILAVIADPG